MTIHALASTEHNCCYIIYHGAVLRLYLVRGRLGWLSSADGCDGCLDRDVRVVASSFTGAGAGAGAATSACLDRDVRAVASSFTGAGAATSACLDRDVRAVVSSFTGAGAGAGAATSACFDRDV